MSLNLRRPIEHDCCADHDDCCSACCGSDPALSDAEALRLILDAYPLDLVMPVPGVVGAGSWRDALVAAVAAAEGDE